MSKTLQAYLILSDRLTTWVGETEEKDELLEAMDALWWKMTPAERAQAEKENKMDDLNKRVDQFVEEKELEISKKGLTIDGPEAGRLWRGIIDELYDKEEDREFSKAVRQEIRDRGYLDN